MFYITNSDSFKLISIPLTVFIALITILVVEREFFYRYTSYFKILKNTIFIVLITFMILASLVFIFKMDLYYRTTLLFYAFFSFLFLILKRFVLKYYLSYLRTAGMDLKNIMIVGLSYGGASLLKATQDSRMESPKPLSVLSYGTYFSINTALSFFITGIIKYKNKEYKITPHEWGLIVLFYNFIDSIEVNYDTGKIKNILKDRIYDKHDDVKNALQKLESNEKKLLENILEGILDSEIKDMIGLMIKKNKELLEYISPDKWANTIYNKIFVVLKRK